MDTKKRITNGCLELFFKYGIKSVSIDNISCHSCISKKTFYQHFKNKEEVIEEITDELLRRHKQSIYETLEESSDILCKLININNRILSQFRTCNQRFIYDLKKYNPKIFKKFLEFRDLQFDNIISDLIKQGKEEGLIKKEIDEHIILELYFNRITAIVEGSILSEKHITDPVFSDVIVIGIIGITTIKGHKRIELKLKDFAHIC